MAPSEADIVRSVAARMDKQARVPTGLTETVEAVLAQGTTEDRPVTYDPATLIALGALIVSAVQLAWTIYRDIKQENGKSGETAAKPSRELVARRVRLKLEQQPGTSPPQLPLVVDLVVEEIEKADPG